MQTLGRRLAKRAILGTIAVGLSAGAGAQRAGAQANPPVGSTAARAAAAPAAEADSARGAPAVRRPSFMLPDVVVQGEDLARFTGGVRQLEIGVPGVVPQQRPVQVDPAPSAYFPSWETPFNVLGPQRRERRAVRGLTRVMAASASGGQAGFALLPDPRGPIMLWGDLEGWDDAWPGVQRWAGRAGLIAAHPSLHPRQRLGVGLGTSGVAWASQRATLGRGAVAGGRQQWAGGHGLWQRQARLLGLPGVMALRGRIGQLHTAWDQPAGDVHRTGRWVVGELAYTTPGASGQPPNLCGQTLVPFGSASRGAQGTHPVVEVRGGLAHLRSPARRAETGARGAARLGLSHGLSVGRISAGAALAGDEDDHVVAPWLALATCGERGTPVVRIEVAPRVVYADEVLLGREALMPGGADFPTHLTGRLETLAVDGLDLDRVDRPGAARAGGGARLPRGALAEMRLRAQTAWPRVLGELLLRGGAGYLRLTAALAELECPLAWIPVDSVALAAGAVAGAGAYRLAEFPDRRVFDFLAESGWRLTRGLELRARYAWTHDEKHDTPQALPFVAEQEGFVALGGSLGRWSWEGAAHLRGAAPAGAGRPRLESFANVSASLGWSFGSARLLLRAENLRDEPIELRPGLGARSPWVEIAWEHVLTRGVP